MCKTGLLLSHPNPPCTGTLFQYCIPVHGYSDCHVKQEISHLCYLLLKDIWMVMRSLQIYDIWIFTVITLLQILTVVSFILSSLTPFPFHFLGGKLWWLPPRGHTLSPRVPGYTQGGRDESAWLTYLWHMTNEGEWEETKYNAEKKCGTERQHVTQRPNVMLGDKFRKASPPPMCFLII